LLRTLPARDLNRDQFRSVKQPVHASFVAAPRQQKPEGHHGLAEGKALCKSLLRAGFAG
jgi:hypothetical protein